VRRDRAHPRSPHLTRSPPEPAAPPPAFAGGLLGLFFVSGTVALVYQSLWMRQLSLILGSTTYAVGTVLAAFMAGLGVGADVMGRRADRTRDVLRLYAALELAIGLVGLASPVVLAQGNGVYAFCYVRLHDRPALLTLARFLIGFAFVVVPAFLMGGTLPVAARYLVRRAGDVGRKVGLLYAANTLGAALGALLLPYGLLPALGLRGSLLASGATNLVIAAIAWRAAGRAASEPAPASREPARRAVVPPAPASALLVAFFLSGFAALGLEVVWNRFFSMYVGSSIYSYALILFLYLVGIVLGGLLYTRLDRRGIAPARVFAGSLLLLLADLAFTVPLMDRVLYLEVATLGTLGIGFAAFQAASVAAVALVVLPPTVLFGVSFPAVVAAFARDPARVGGDLGRAYLVNTGGTTLGALAASFVMIPGLGVRGALDALALLVLPALVLATPARRRALPALGLGVLLALVPLLCPAWDARFMHTNFAKEPEQILDLWREGNLTAGVRGIAVRELRDGVDVTASVAVYEDMTALLVNGKTDATDGPDMAMQFLIGHLPLLVRPEAKDVLVIGMGSGVTLGAVTRHPVAAIDLVEISPEVLDLGDRHFRHVNHGALHDPRVTAFVEDGRNFVAFNPTRAYDVIVSEPSNPWMTGVANLFTDEFFAALRRRLRPDGVLAQWFHYYNMRLEDIRTLLTTLRGHFPAVYGFAFHHREEIIGDVLLLAAAEPLDFAPALAALGADGPATEDLRPFGFAGPDTFLRGFVLGPEVLDRFVAGAPVNSDDHPHIELDAPRALFRNTTFENLAALLEASAGARLPVAAVAAGEPGVHLVLPPGFQRTGAAYRVETDDGPPDGLPLRTPVLELAFADGRGNRLTVAAVRGLRDGQGLVQLARLLAGHPIGTGVDATVHGHNAVAFEMPDDRTLVAWACPQSEASYAASASPEAARGLRCHGGD
jgi:spermidine synthase